MALMCFSVIAGYLREVISCRRAPGSLGLLYFNNSDLHIIRSTGLFRSKNLYLSSVTQKVVTARSSVFGISIPAPAPDQVCSRPLNIQ